MKYDVIGDHETKPTVCVLVPTLQLAEVKRYYVAPHLNKLNENIMVADLYLDRTKKKTSVKDIKEYLNDLLPNLINAGITYLIVTQPEYFKVITKQAKTDAVIGDTMDTVVTGLRATYCPSYSRIFYDPEKISSKINLALSSAVNNLQGGNDRIGSDIIKFAAYPTTVDEISMWLNKLLEMNCPLTIDIEGFDLKHYACGLGSITFCWNQHEGVAFLIDKSHTDQNEEIRELLKAFFVKFMQKAIYHNITFDVYVLVYQLFMDHILDQNGMLKGLEVLLRNWECTKLISYLATNSCAGNELGLKAQSQEFTGNYAVADIKDITKISPKKLLEYNLIDGLATWYVFNKNMPILLADDQMNAYSKLFRPAVVDIIQMQLTGMPINMTKVKALDRKLNTKSDGLHKLMSSLPLIQGFESILKDEFVIKKNESYKKKVITVDDLKAENGAFNPNSGPQLQRLLYDDQLLGLPVLDFTDTKKPATGAETLEKLINHTKNLETIALLNYLIEFKAISTIISTFLPAFLRAQMGDDGWHYLFGNFNLGGTASGRLSSSGPNLQNIPSSGSSATKAKLAKMIKDCFEAPDGWLFIGLDFDSLEDKISAVTTKDPEKIKVYSDGYDGHCLRALAYFGQHMPNLELAPDGAKTFYVVVGGRAIYLHGEEEIIYLGAKMTGLEFFNLINS